MRIRRKSAASGTGGITVFMVLAVLTVAVFSVLTLSSALADLRLSEKNAAQVEAYYAAEGKAVAAVAAVEQAWRGGTATEAELEAAAMMATPDAIYMQTSGFAVNNASISIPVEGERSFEVVLRLLGAPNTDGHWVEITTWTMAPADFGEVISPMELLN